MIWLFDVYSRRMCSYKTFDELCDYFNRREALNLLVDPQEYTDQEEGWEGGNDNDEEEDYSVSQQQWGFLYYPHHKLSNLLEHLEEISFIQIVQEAYKEEFEMIEVLRGEVVSEWIVIMAGVDGQQLMREWCFDYACAHGMIILETLVGGVCCHPDSDKTALSAQTLE